MWVLLVLWAGGPVSAVAGGQSQADNDYFEIHVRPLLVRNCIGCHGEAKQEGSLRLTTLEEMLRGGDSGPVLVPGQPDQSLILEALRHESFEMPPDGKLSDESIEAMATWIRAGSPWPRGEVLRPLSGISDEDRQWWSVQPIRDPPVPDVDDPAWCRNEIDHFILQRLQSEGITPSKEASARELNRRVHFAVTGLPPEWEPDLEVKAANDPDWYDRLVDQLLEQSAYGENQARFWLDLVRYADSDGYRADAHRPAAHQYRDYVIESFHADKPYDRFVMEQLAGDEIAPDDREAIIGTMFLRHWIYEWNQRDVEGQWQEVLDDVTETTADVFLALGLKCARCHDHKFDPILQKDFFRLQAFFRPLHPREDLPVASIDERQKYLEQLRAWEEATAELRERLHEIERPELLAHATREGFEKFVPEIKAMVVKRPGQRTPYEHQIATFAERQFDLLPEKLPEWLDEATEAERQRLRAELAKLDHLKPEPLPVQEFVATDVGPTAPTTWVIGDPEKRPVEPGIPTILDESPMVIEPPHPALHSTGRRTALAKWITHPRNPLTARVIVNRIWEQHFGLGLVENASDFGNLGSPPSHPELLDWLATRFMEDGWSLKKLHRRILTSATYRQSSLRAAGEEVDRIDPGNQLLWRMNPRRLSAEEIIDSMLSAGGELAGKQRRAVYETVSRNKVHPVAGLFDFPDRIRSVAKRHHTTTSTQALLLMNNAWTRQRANAMVQHFAELESESFTEAAYRRLFGRQPDSTELAAAQEFLRQYAAITPEATPPHVPLAGDEGGTGQRASDEVTPVAQVCLNEETSSESGGAEVARAQPSRSSPAVRVRIALLHALMNSNEMLYVD